jgi:hypothetical protein
MEVVANFIARQFSPRRPRSTDGRELSGAWRASIEYRLAELGFGLQRGIAVRGVPRVPGDLPGRAHLQAGVLWVDGGAVDGGRFREAFLLLDLPHAMLDRAACRRGDTPEEKVATWLAAAFLTLQRVADRGELFPGRRATLPVFRSEHRSCPWRNPFHGVRRVYSGCWTQSPGPERAGSQK